jgi:hypothetical protein
MLPSWSIYPQLPSLIYIYRQGQAIAQRTVTLRDCAVPVARSPVEVEDGKSGWTSFRRSLAF